MISSVPQQSVSLFSNIKCGPSFHSRFLSLLLFPINKTISSYNHRRAICLAWSDNEVFLNKWSGHGGGGSWVTHGTQQVEPPSDSTRVAVLMGITPWRTEELQHLL